MPEQLEGVHVDVVIQKPDRPIAESKVGTTVVPRLEAGGNTPIPLDVLVRRAVVCCGINMRIDGNGGNERVASPRHVSVAFKDPHLIGQRLPEHDRLRHAVGNVLEFDPHDVIGIRNGRLADRVEHATNIRTLYIARVISNFGTPIH